MTFPNFEGKHDGDDILTPAALLAHRVDQLGDRIPEGLPTRVILTYQPQLLQAVETFEDTTRFDVGGFAGTVHAIDRTDGRVGVVGGFGIGAPAAAAVLEELISYGCDTFLSVGAAGGLVDDMEIGDLVVCDGAVRDEGVSHHYVSSDVAAVPDPVLAAAMAASFEMAALEHRVGSVWTTDALFRETTAELLHYVEDGVISVDMEAAALFVVAAHRDVRLASAFCISDMLNGGVWSPAFDSNRLVGNMWKLMESAIAVLEDD